MSTLKLCEQGTLGSATAAKGLFPITIISEGTGSTGIYSREMLQENVDAFTKGTKSFIDHPKDPTKPWERSLTTIAGKLQEDAVYVEEDGVGKLKGNLKVDNRWIDFVEEYKNEIGISIYIDAYGERNADDKVVVEGFVKGDPYASIDLVVAAGRGGRFDSMVESYRQIENSLGDTLTEDGSEIPPVRTTTSKEYSNMELEDLAAKVDKLTESLDAFVNAASPILESLKPVPADENAVSEDVVLEALIDSKLPKSERKVVLEAVRNGTTLEDAIKDRVEYTTNLISELKVQEGFVQGESSFKGDALDLGKVLG
jgi:hypothetical protein